MKDMMVRVVWALVGATGVAACASTGISEGASQACRAEAAAALVGRPAPDDDTIRRRTGSASVRRLAPGAPATRDYRVERVTVTIAGDQVVAAACG